MPRENEDAFYDTIIVGADFSEGSKRVFRQALKMAKKWEAKVILAHIAPLQVYDAYVMGELPVVDLPTTEEETENLRRQLTKVYSVQEGDNVRVEVLQGDPAEDLIELAQNYPNPMIAISHSEKGAWMRWAAGSVSKDLALKSTVPVWIQ